MIARQGAFKREKHFANFDKGEDRCFMYPKKPLDTATFRNGLLKPFHILKGISFVGTYQASVHLIDTGEGLVMIDTGYLNTFYWIVNGIYTLGYKPSDVKYIILTHWHGDHVEGVKPMLTIAPNAKTIIGVRDDRILSEQYGIIPDLVVKDGDIVTCGKVNFRFVETPGHTVGTMSVFFDYTEDGRIYHVGMFGGAGRKTLSPDHADYYQGAENEYFRSLERLKSEKVDLFLGNHCWNNDTDGKAIAMETDPDRNPFVDEREFYRFLDFCRKDLEDRIKNRRNGN